MSNILQALPKEPSKDLMELKEDDSVVVTNNILILFYNNRNIDIETKKIVVGLLDTHDKSNRIIAEEIVRNQLGLQND